MNITGMSNIGLQNLEDYILASELCSIAGIHIANINVILKRYNMVEDYDFIKFKAIVLLRKNSNWPPNFREIINSGELTNLRYLVPETQFKEVLCNPSFTNFPKVKVNNKKFLDCSSLPELFSKVPFIFSKSELEQYSDYKYIEIKYNKYIGFY